MKLKYLAVLIAVAFVGVAVFQPEPTDARGWHYKLKKPPKKRPKPPKKQKAQYVQLDPLRITRLFDQDSKGRVGPNVIIAMDTSMRMQYDFDGWYYDEHYWRTCSTHDDDSHKDCDDDSKKDGFSGQWSKTVASSLGVPANARWYRRKYKNLVRTEEANGNNRKTLRFDAESISVVHDRQPEFLTFYDPSRLGMARDGLLQVVEENMYVSNFGLVRTRHGGQPEIPDSPGNELPVYLSSASQQNLLGDLNNKSWRVTWVKPNIRNVDQNSTKDVVAVQVIDKPDASALTAWWLMQPVDSDQQDSTLVPAGFDDGTFQDSPVKTLLEDARASVVKAMEKDKDQYRACRNNAVILVVGGKDGGGADPVPVATTFQAVSAKGVTKPVPIYVIAVGPPAADVPQLKAIAAASGGEYFEVYDASQIAFAANYAVQSVFRRPVEFDANLESEFLTTSPIVGSVDLANAKDITGSALPLSSLSGGGALSQGANVVLTTGFALPGFETRIRAFRTYKPVADATKAYGYKFSKDGTRLWVAHAPGADQRNIFTYIPGVGYKALTQGNLAVLKPYLAVDNNDDWAAEVIDFVRQQPMGAVLTSTPALVAPPSLKPVPDAEYATFAGARRNRRSTVYFGANDGMVHALDGRLGVEVWAFVPFNLLPKLKTLMDGQSIGSFDYFVDSSPKVADVKVGGQWRTYMFIGQGGGGTYYQAFDISDANLGVGPTVDSEAAVIAAFADPGVIPLAWTFPSMSTFDYTLETDNTPYGDIRADAPAWAKSVGQTWSLPSVAQITNATSPWTLVVGSGYLPPYVQSQANRGNTPAGTTLYVLDASTGLILASRDVGDDANKDSLKNSLTADPTTTAASDSRFVDRVYIGDAEGKLWRFGMSWNGTSVSLNAPVSLYDAAEWSPIFASAAVSGDGSGGHYVYVASGIDILPWTRMKKIVQFAMVGLHDTGGATATKTFELKLDKSDNKGGDERPSSNPTVAGGVVFFTTTTEYPATPCCSAEASLFALTPGGSAGYDLNRDGKLDSADKQTQQAIGRATSVYVADKHLYFGTDQGLEIFGDPEGFNNSIVRTLFRTLTWREIR